MVGNGLLIFNNKVCLQWGTTASVSSRNNVIIQLAVSYTNVNYVVSCFYTARQNGDLIRIGNRNLTQFQTITDNFAPSVATCSRIWMSIGY